MLKYRPPMQPGRRYVVISPCRDEAKYMRQTLDSVIAQSIRPARWIIVDDGSTDETPQILAEYRAQHNWIEVVTRNNRGRRSVGPGVIDAFYAGYETINPDDYDFLCKLDLDLRLPPRYFETSDAADDERPAHRDLQRKSLRRARRKSSR